VLHLELEHFLVDVNVAMHLGRPYQVTHRFDIATIS
jgi:hypothetical protein